MKTVVSLLLLLLSTRPGWSQVNVVLLRDTATYQLSQAALDKQFPPLIKLFQAKPKEAHAAIQTHQKQFSAFMGKRADVPQRGFGVTTHAYYQADGKAQYVLVDTDRSLPDSVLTRLITTLTHFYVVTPHLINGSVPFRVTSFLTYGRTFVTKRTVRRGAGIISTLAAAQNTTRPDTVTTLAFNQLDLLTVPDVVYRFPNLKELDLSKNSLHELPARLTADLPKLTRLSLLYNRIPDDSVFITPNKHLLALNLQGNKLTRVPLSIRRNRRLESLWLGNNALKSLDVKPLHRLRRLTDLNLYNAGLTSVPKQMGRLKHLKVLDLYYNKFTELPRRLGRMKRLEQLAIAYNDLKELPVSVTKLRRLQTLYVHHNRISQLPAEFQRLRRLRVLDLGYNWFTVPPTVLASLPALEELDLSNNNVQELPTSLGSLRGLKKLHLRSNPLTRTDAKAGPYAPVIQQLEANQTEVFY